MEPQRKANTRVVPPPEQKVEQLGGAGSPSPSVLSSEMYTHGGVKKTKFEPKVPTRRLKKLSAVKNESSGEGASGGEIPKELQKLLQQAENDGQRAFRPNQRTSKVAFGFGGFSSRSSMPSAGFQHKSSAGGGKGGGGGSRGGRGSGSGDGGGGGGSGGGGGGSGGGGGGSGGGGGGSGGGGGGSGGGGGGSGGGGGGSGGGGGGSGGGGGGSGGGGGGSGGGGGGGSSRGVEKHEFMQADGMYTESKRGIRRNVEVFDLERYFPVTLPMRKPYSGDAAQLDDEEFGDGDDVQEEDEDAVEPAEELGFTEKNEADMLFFFQLPKGLPLSLNPIGKEKNSTSGSAKLEDLRNGGAMGKILVYESGAVKFKVGDVIFDALPGTECTFAQELCAVNTTTKRCGFLGEVYKRIVLTPDISNVLPDISNLHT